MEKRDPYKHKERYFKWLKANANKIKGISLTNSSLILAYLYDMQEGLNISTKSKKGPRSFIRLNNLIQRMVFLAKKLEEFYNLEDISLIDENTLHKYFNGIKNGEIRRVDGKIYQDPANFVKIFKAFWHWWQKVNRKEGNEIKDITIDLDATCDKPQWVYLTEEQVEKLCKKASFEYKVLITFLYDSGIRAPTELLNIRISDFHNGFQELTIREEVSKTFGRRIKLMFSSELIKRYILEKALKDEDYLFSLSPFTINNNLQKLAKSVFRSEKSLAGQKYSELTMYDFRHCSCCYWLPKYKSESGLKYRFGWKKSERINYYSEMLGMQDTIKEEDLVDDTSSLISKRKINKIYTDNKLQETRLDFLEKKIQELVKKII
jgi:integrase